MNSMNFLQVLLALGAIVWICSRQLTWRPVDPARFWRGPLVFTIIGLASLSDTTTRITPVDLGLVVVELLLAAVAGAAMGRLARFRPATDEARRRTASSRRGSPDITTETRTGWLGLALWIGLIAVRIVLDVGSHQLGYELVSATGMIFIVVAVNRAVRALVISARLEHRTPAVA
ncbi:hypothetical protein JTF08_10435 [Micrococcaceae bacterium RIT802]|nr:hypothetical protein [Micrococcaceae bacterium RIT 802]